MISSRMLALWTAMVLLTACAAQNQPTRAVSGQLDVTQFRLAGAQVVAMSSSGRVFRAPISTTGAFRIALPTNATYTLRFANSTSAPQLFDAFAVLAPLKAGGVRTHWITLTPGAEIGLGRIGRLGSTSPNAALSEVRSHDGMENDDGKEDEGKEEDDDEACDLSGGSDMEDVDSEHDALDDTDSDHDGVADSRDDRDDREDCASRSDDGDDCHLTDREEHDNDAEHDDDCHDRSGAPGAVPGNR